MIELRDYQIKAVSDLCDAYRDNCNAVVQLPTGTGKTTVICEFIRQWRNRLDPNKRVLVIAHRIELIDQIRDRLLSFGIKSGKIKSGETVSEEFQVQVGLIQSLRSNKRKPKSLGLIIVDEAHHITAQSYRNLIDYYQIYQPKVFGFTATPSRLDGSALGDIFHQLFEYGQLYEFIQNKYLSPLKHYATSNLNLNGITIKSTGDYSESELLEKMSESNVMADLLKGYEDRAKGKKAIVFCVNSKHAKLVAERYNKHGYQAIAMDYTTPSELRQENLKKFKNNELLILCNVNLFTEGFDCPDVEVVQLARPTKSLNLYLQMVGRAMRIAPNKTHGIILDNAMLWREHGLSTRNRNWTITGRNGINNHKVVLKKNADGLIQESINAQHTPEESEDLELVEISDAIPIPIENSLELILLALPISLWELIEYLEPEKKDKFPKGQRNPILRFVNGLVDDSVIKFQDDIYIIHFLTDQKLRWRDILKILGLNIGRQTKSITSKKVFSQLHSIFEGYNLDQLVYLNNRVRGIKSIMLWADFGYFSEVLPLSSFLEPSQKIDPQRASQILRGCNKGDALQGLGFPSTFFTRLKNKSQFTIEEIQTLAESIRGELLDSVSSIHEDILK